MSTPVVPGNGGRTEPSPIEPTVVPAAPATGRPRHSVLILPTPEHAEEKPGRPLAAARGLLARLVPRPVAQSRARQAAEFDAVAREALRSALKLEAAAPRHPAPTARPTAAPTTSLPASVQAVAPAIGPLSPPITPGTTAATAPSSGRTAPAAPEPAADAPESSAGVHTSTWTTPPGTRRARSAAPRVEPPEEPPGPPRRRQPGETAPDFLLRPPTNVAPVADEFFDGLVERIEGHR